MNKSTRLFRPRPPEEFTDGVAAWLNPKTNVVTYNMEMFDLRRSPDFAALNSLTDAHLLATTE